AGQPIKTWLGVVRLGDQPEQVPGRPTEGVRLVTPAGEEASAILYRIPPPLGRNQRGAAGLERGYNPSIATRKIGKTTPSGTLKTVETRNRSCGWSHRNRRATF